MRTNVWVGVELGCCNPNVGKLQDLKKEDVAKWQSG